MSNPQKRIIWTVCILLAIVAGVAGLYTAQLLCAKQNNTKMSIEAMQQAFHGTLLDKPRQVQPFALMGVDHQPFTQVSIRNQWTMMFFGFTHCGLMCPTVMAELGKMYRLLEQQHARVLPQVVMITLDPKRDSLQRLGQYAKAFDSHFYGARGDDDAIRAMTRDLGIAYATIVRQDAKDSTKQDDIEHTGAVMLFNPQGDLVAFFTTPHHAEAIANDFLLLINQGSMAS